MKGVTAFNAGAIGLVFDIGNIFCRQGVVNGDGLEVWDDDEDVKSVGVYQEVAKGSGLRAWDDNDNDGIESVGVDDRLRGELIFARAWGQARPEGLLRIVGHISLNELKVFARFRPLGRPEQLDYS